jgi:hypothetical protein
MGTFLLSYKGTFSKSRDTASRRKMYGRSEAVKELDYAILSHPACGHARQPSRNDAVKNPLLFASCNILADALPTILGQG